VYEAKNSDRIAEYDMKLMDIDSDTLGIPETEYDARVTMPSAEFSRIVRDLSQLGESVRIEVSKEGVRFASDGEAANGSVLLKPTDGAGVGKMPKPKEEDGEDVEDPAEEEDDGIQEVQVKEEKKEKTKVKKEKGDDEDVEMDDEEKDNEEFKPGSDGEEEVAASDEEGSGKKRKKKSNGDSKPSKKAKTSSKSKSKKKEEEDSTSITIEMNQHVSLTFSLKYLVNFSKSSSLCNTVQLMMSNDVPLLVAYEFGQGAIKYYLAPKIGDD